MEYFFAALLILLNLFWLFLTAIGLPGNWLMLLAVGIWSWFWPELETFSRGTLIGLIVLAVLGEILEFASGALGAKHSGGSRWGAGGAIVGGIIGGLVGTGLVPIPLIGTLFGMCLGAFVGALVLEYAKGRTLAEAIQSGRGAAIGRAFGVVAKLVVGAVMWLVIAVAAFWP